MSVRYYEKILYIVIPCYNEEEVLPETARRLKEKCEELIIQDKISEHTRVIFIDDGSKDNTWCIIEIFTKLMVFSVA